jgi:hypothetical protein
MSIDVDQSLLERALTILRDSDDYGSIKRDLDEYFREDDWADVTAGDGPFALAFTRNLEEGGWLPQSDLEPLWSAVALADPQQPSTSDDLHRLLKKTIAAFKDASPDGDAAVDEPAGFESVTEMTGANYAGWQQGYDPDEQVWKYRDPSSGQWRESHQAFPPITPGSRIFRIGERTFLPDGDAELELWPHPDIADTYYDSTGTYDLMGNPVAPTELRSPTDKPTSDDPFAWVIAEHAERLSAAWGAQWGTYLSEQLDHRWGSGWQANPAEDKQAWLADLMPEFVPDRAAATEIDLDKLAADLVRESIAEVEGAESLSEADLVVAIAAVRKNLEESHD